MSESPTVERETPPPINELAAALAAFQSEMPVVPKSKTANVRTRDGGNYSYTYADLADVSAAAMPILARHGLAFTCLPGPDGLTAVLAHTSGQRVTGSLPIRGATPQEVGSSLTYNRRYLLGCLTGLVTDDDDDGNTAERAAKAPPRAERPPRGTRARPEPRPPIAPPLATPEAPAPDGSIDVPLPEPEPEPTTTKAAPQVLRAFHASWGELFPTDQSREDRLAVLAAIVGRDLASSGDMTRDEVYRALGFLERMKVGAAGVVRREGRWVAVAYEEPPER
jgi:hypothetical protein